MRGSLKLAVAGLVALTSVKSYAQCTVEAFPADSVIITCGESLDLELSAFGTSGNFAINNDFNDGTVGAGWDGTLAATYTNPCVNSPDGSIYMWMGQREHHLELQLLLQQLHLD